MRENNTSEFPKVLFMGELTIGETTGGSMQLYRLFKEYPAHKFLNIYLKNQYDTTTKDSDTVRNVVLKLPFLKIFNNRILSVLNLMFQYLYIKKVTLKAVQKKIDTYKPDVIVTIIHGKFWVIVRQLAQQNGIPYIVINQDNHIFQYSKLIQNQLRKDFRYTYQDAAISYCISNYMIEYYENLTGKKGTLLPTLGQEGVSFEDNKHKNSSFTVGYGGSLFGDYVFNFIHACHALAKVGGKMIAYTNVDLDYIIKAGLKTDNVTIFPLVPPQEVLKILSQVDMLYLPMDFSEKAQLNMMIAFPSKTPDYLLLKKPLFIHAPAYSSVVKWAQNLKQEIGIIVTSNNGGELDAQIQYFMQPTVHAKITKTLQITEIEDFNPDKIRMSFYQKMKQITQHNTFTEILN